MPIYEYICKKCGYKLEKLQKLNDSPLITCPSCQQDALSKLISASSFQLKGNGWYATDFKDKNKDVKGKADVSKTEAKTKAATDKAAKPNQKKDAEKG
ncbi:MAG: zinc ribbon domain-containing protein [Gammaproteobacteria bacterium]|nr:zinc ribbon domain-containing protein [Gammaproteobacteria bacterium]